MRFSVVTALCAAPLALAGTLQAELVARGAMAGSENKQIANDPKAGPQNSNSKANNNIGQTQIVQSTTEEVIIIWFNNGGTAATSTVTNTVTVTAQAAAGAATAAGSAAGAAAAQATHNVRAPFPMLGKLY
jgi:hypothetical protein